MYLRYYLLMAVAVFLVTTAVKYLIRFWQHKRHMMKYVQHLPSPKEYPIIGSALRFFGKNSEGMYSKLKLSAFPGLIVKTNSKVSVFVIFHYRDYERRG